MPAKNECPQCQDTDYLCPVCNGKPLSDEEFETIQRFDNMMRGFNDTAELLGRIWHSDLNDNQKQHILSNFGY